MSDLKWKSVEDYIKEDESLTRKVTYEAYADGALSPGNSDYNIEDAYEEYLRFKKQYSER